MRAAALTELTLQGVIQDRRGKAVAAPTGSVDDRFLASVLSDTSGPGPLSGGEVVVRELEPVRVLRRQARDVVLLQPDPATVPADQLAMAVLAAEGEADTVLTLSERWTHRKQLKSLTKHFDTLVPGPAAGFRTAVATARSHNGGWS